MKRVLWGLGTMVVLVLLLSGCGGGGGGGVTPPQPGDVSRLFPLTQRTQEYDLSETEHFYAKLTGVIIGEAVRGNLRVGPFSLPIVIPKKLLPQRQGTHTYEETNDSQTTGAHTTTIDGTHTGDPFPSGVIASIAEEYTNANVKNTHIEKLDGQIIQQKEDSWPEEERYRNFYTNENGEVKIWGSQDYDYGTNQWGTIEADPSPLLVLMGGATSWTVGHIKEDIEDATFSGDMVATLAGQETITVPAGRFTCYKVIYKLTNVKLETPPGGIQITSFNLNSTMTIWLALDKGIVKSENTKTLSATFKDQETGGTGSVSMTSTETQVLK